MTDLPPPLVPAEVDCTDLDGFMLNVERLMASELVALSSHEVVGAALFLWCRAWKQRPAASLPDDDRVLAAFARLPLARFRKLRGEILRGFVKCSDGRLYHPVVSGEAVNAYARKQSFRKKRETDAERLRKWREDNRETANETQAETGIETQNETRFVAEGQGQGQLERKKERSTASPAEYAFIGKVVRLKPDDFANWQKAFRNLDLMAEMTARDAWLASEESSSEDRRKWFLTTSRWLANRNAEAAAKGLTPKGALAPRPQADDWAKDIDLG